MNPYEPPTTEHKPEGEPYTFLRLTEDITALVIATAICFPIALLIIRLFDWLDAIGCFDHIKTLVRILLK